MTKPVDDITKAASGYWNSNPVSASNPGGLDESDDGLTAGHVDNFPAAVGAVGRMAQWVGGVADTIDAQAFAGGGTVAMIWDAGTADANPGAGKARGNAASLSAVTALHLSTTDADVADVAALLTSWGGGGSATKGALRLAVVGNRSQRADFRVVGAAIAHSGYVTLPVAFVASTVALTAGAPLALGFVQAGDVGASGPTTGYWCGAAGGTANALTATTGSGLTAVAAGTIVGLKVGAAANGGAATLAIDVVAALPIRKGGSALAGGELAAASDVWCMFDGAAYRLMGGGGVTIKQAGATVVANAMVINLTGGAQVSDAGGGVATVYVPTAASGRYWGVWTNGPSWNQSGGAYYQDYIGVKLYGSSDLSGSALTVAAAAASSVYSGSYVAMNAFDNNASTDWVTASGSSIAPQWIYADLGSGVSSRVGSLSITALVPGGATHAYIASSITIKCSANGTDWVVVATLSVPDTTGVGGTGVTFN